jgi:hypothetical protein
LAEKEAVTSDKSGISNKGSLDEIKVTLEIVITSPLSVGVASISNIQ